MAENLNVNVRESRGKREARRLRRSGSIPAILYGHGEANCSLTVASDAMSSIIRHGGRVVDLNGAVNEKAFIRDLQWDVYGTEVLHVDFARVSEHERIEVKVAVELRGHAAGIKDGGVVEHFVHEVEIECEALSIPEKLELNVNDLKIGDQMTAADLRLPPGINLISDPEAVLVHCVAARVEEEVAAPAAGAVEPEVIGRTAEDEEAEE
ncbi:MAG: 50S ribosomal protein L25 [Planctomycetia bacterium]|nr:50S ribosomal protein L25 [Planctomycetia bacterium]